VQHVNIKIFASKADIDLVDAIPIFHRWIQDNTMPEMLIDVADYKHVPDGPGVMIIGNQVDYSLDEQEGRLGVLYNRKGEVDGDAQAALKISFEAARNAAKKLEVEAAFAGKLKFDAGDVEVIINDRVLAPNNDATLQALEPEIQKFFAGIYGHNDFVLEHRGEPRERFRVGVKTGKPVDA